ncbi:MAG TPA: pyridoxine 5'-phosphate synthase [Cytophagales bacterium]|nr:pyridoxine 5'-phosphate synthase [Cytophagales bacterium]HAA23419.1 pyridoxine 5'-phosphate synthase [Cytophagales bacterium]HAP58100.1 pyridoxine 5'-phosphate synthase [Cytophagales bacterium]
MTRLSVNINKFATLRNARGGNNPDVVQAALDCERFGAQGITVHPRPDERHIRYDDVVALKDVVTTEFNIEGYPDDRYMGIIEQVRPAQATLVPDPPDVLTSNAGWDTVKNADQLSDVLGQLKEWGVRTSIFVDTDLTNIEGAAHVGTDRIELYTEPYAAGYLTDKKAAVAPYVKATQKAVELGLEINAGHDLELDNLKFLKEQLPQLDEVSIGHALICDALYLGLENAIQRYLLQLQ